MIRNYLRQAYRTLLPFLYSRSQFKLFLKAGIEDIRHTNASAGGRHGLFFAVRALHSDPGSLWQLDAGDRPSSGR